MGVIGNGGNCTFVAGVGAISVGAMCVFLHHWIIFVGSVVHQAVGGATR